MLEYVIENYLNNIWCFVCLCKYVNNLFVSLLFSEINTNCVFCVCCGNICKNMSCLYCLMKHIHMFVHSCLANIFTKCVFWYIFFWNNKTSCLYCSTKQIQKSGFSVLPEVFPGHPWTLRGRSPDAPRKSPDAPRTLPGRFLDDPRTVREF